MLQDPQSVTQLTACYEAHSVLRSNKALRPPTSHETHGELPCPQRATKPMGATWPTASYQIDEVTNLRDLQPATRLTASYEAYAVLGSHKAIRLTASYKAHSELRDLRQLRGPQWEKATRPAVSYEAQSVLQIPRSDTATKLIVIYEPHSKP